LDVREAVPLGLILNEAITNSIRHAFPGDRSGVIGVSFKTAPSGEYFLSVSDNGVGIPEGVLTRQTNSSLGMRLIERLSRDINGEFVVGEEVGTRIRVSFHWRMPA
jgi:two-component sensor histidine kinase